MRYFALKMRHFLLLAASVILIPGGCKPTSPAESGEDADNAPFGMFEGEVVANWHPDGRLMTLREDFAFIDTKNRKWVAPAGSVVNGASIPVAFWSIIGGPFEGKYRAASVIHDVGCIEMRETWEDVHWMFYEACRCGGVNEFDAKMMYYAVYHFGPRWEPVVDTVIEPHMTASGQVVNSAVEVQRLARNDPPPPTPAEIAQIESFIAEENPSIDDIEVVERSELRRRPRRSKNRARGNDEAEIAAPGTDDQPIQGLMSSTLVQSPSPAPLSEEPLAMRAQLVSSGARSGLSDDEQEWIANIARQFIEQQAGEERPANYIVGGANGAYRVTVEYLALDELNQWSPYEGGLSTIVVSRNGQVLESYSGN